MKSLSVRVYAAIGISSLSILLLSTVLFAASVSVSGDVIAISAPESVKKGETESDGNIIVFPERQNVELTRDVIAGITEPGEYDQLVDLTIGVIPEGTVVNSYLLHADPEGTPSEDVVYEGSVEFGEDVLGIIVSYFGLKATDRKLGADETSYPRWTFLRGVELIGAEHDRIILSGNTVEVRFETRRVIDQIRVVTVAGSGIDLTDGLVGHWKFDEGEGQMAMDSSPSEIHGTLGSTTGSDEHDPDWTTGKVGPHALDFNGTNDFVDLDTDLNLGPADLTISAWVKTPLIGNKYRDVITKWDIRTFAFQVNKDGGEANCDINLGTATSGAMVFNEGNEGDPANLCTFGTIRIDDDMWHHVVVVREGTERRIYVDGVLDTAASDPTVWDLSSTSESFIGRLTSGQQTFLGPLDDIRIYNRAISDDEIGAAFDLAE